MRKHSITTWMAAFALSLTAMSCSKSNTQTVTITFPDWKQLQTSTYERQSLYSSPTTGAGEFEDVGVLSVTVNGQPTRYTANGVQGVFPWSTDSRTPVPKSVTFQAEKGALIQAVAIIENEGARQFFYGDAAVGSGDTQTLDLYMSNAFTTGLAEGNLIGRYITKVDASNAPWGPTGTFQYRFQPPGGKPSMVVTTSEMFSGWMNITTFGSNVLTFTWPDGTPVFAQGVQADDRLVDTPNPKRIARIRIPESYSPKDGRIEHRGANLLTVGYFGPAAETAAGGSALRVCMTSSSAPGVPVANLFSDAALSDQFLWVGRNAIALADAHHTVSVLKNSNGVHGGAENGSSDYCQNTGSEYTNFISIDPENFSANDEIIGVKGPFIRNASRSFVATTYNNILNQVEVSWTLAPNAGDDLDGFSVFFREKPASSSEDELRTMDGYACNAFRSGEIPGFKETKVGVGTTATVDNVTLAQYANSQIVVCPRAKDGTLYKAGAMPYSSGGSGGVHVTKLQIRSADGVYTAPGAHKLNGPSLCYPIDIEAADAAGHQGFMPNFTTIHLSTARMSLQFFTDPSCMSGSLSPSLDISNFNGRSRIFVLDSGGGMGAYEIEASDLGSTPLTSSVYYGENVGNAVDYANDPVIKAVVPSVSYRHSCVPVDFTLLNDATSQTLVAYASGLSMNFPSTNPSLSFYSANDWACSGTPLNGPVNFTSNSLSVFMKYTGSTGTIDMDSAVANSIGASGGFGSTPVTMLEPGAPARFEFTLPSMVSAGVCTPLAVILTDSTGRPSPPSAPISVSLSILGGDLFNDATTCAGGSGAVNTANVTISNNTTSSTTVYYKASAGGPQMSVTASSSGLSTSSRQVQINP